MFYIPFLKGREFYIAIFHFAIYRIFFRGYLERVVPSNTWQDVNGSQLTLNQNEWYYLVSIGDIHRFHPAFRGQSNQMVHSFYTVHPDCTNTAPEFAFVNPKKATRLWKKPNRSWSLQLLPHLELVSLQKNVYQRFLASDFELAGRDENPFHGGKKRPSSRWDGRTEVH